MARQTTPALLEDHGAGPADLLVRHQVGDRGEVPPGDARENEVSVRRGWARKR